MSEQKKADAFVSLAKHVVEQYVNTGEIPPPPSPLPSEMQGRSGVFVCLKKHGQLRGCMGTIEPTQENIAEEVIRNAVTAAVADPRFPHVTKEELPFITYSIDVLSPPELITGPHELDVRRYGVIVESGNKRGLLLPNLEGVDTIEEQVDIAKRKAGIFPDEPVALYRFTVTRHGEY